MVGSHFRDTREEYRNVSEDIALNIALYSLWELLRVQRNVPDSMIEEINTY